MHVGREKRSAKVERVNYKHIYTNFNGVCGICELALNLSDVHWDHIIPIAKGGEHSNKNIQPSHEVCNRIKGNRSLEWAKKRVAQRVRALQELERI